MNPTPGEPIEHTLARIEAIGRLATSQPTCEHCTPVLEPLNGHTGTMRAFGILHEPDCVTHVEDELAPAVEYDLDDD